MDCRSFRRQHVEYLDQALPADVLATMRVHVYACADCSRFDVTLRRGLLVARSLQAIEPSLLFRARLRRRLALQSKAPLPTAEPQVVPAPWSSSRGVMLS